jgi:hypothetical protein
VIETNIRHPLDSHLLYDLVQVLTRVMKEAVELSHPVQ